MSLGRLLSKRSLLVMGIVFALSLFAVPTAFAAGIEDKVGDVDVTMYGPSVVWQGTNAHVIVKMENKGSKSVTVNGLLKFQDGKEGQFTTGTKKDAITKDGVKGSKDLKPGESKYIAFTYILPKNSAPLGMYSVNLTLSVDSASKTIPWNFDVRTGQIFQAETQGIVMTIYGLSAGMLVFWFVYFKGFIKKNFNVFAGEQPE